MARQGSIAKMGFYPAHPDAIDQIISHLSLPSAGPKGINIIDPCCGEGKAIDQIARGLGVRPENVYAVELDANRGAMAKELMPEARIVTPASFMGMRITGYSFGLAYVNPPFDTELGGGGRQEQTFVETATRCLVPSGTLVLVCPLKALEGNRDFCQYIDSNYENVRVWNWPKEHRHFNEIVLIGTRRKVTLTDDLVYQLGTLFQMEFQYNSGTSWDRVLPTIGAELYHHVKRGRTGRSEPCPPYYLAAGWKPHQFHKSDYLPDELTEALAKSPLNDVIADVKIMELARPPLPPGKGHVAMLLAAGMLNGIVAPEGQEVHVVRGSSKKVEFYNAEASSSDENSKGELVTKEVYSQRVVLVIRAVYADGEIITLSDAPEPDKALTPEEYAEEQAKAATHNEARRWDVEIKDGTVTIQVPSDELHDKLESIMRSAGMTYDRKANAVL